MLNKINNIIKTFVFVASFVFAGGVFAQPSNPVQNVAITPQTISGSFIGGLEQYEIIFTLVGVNTATNTPHESQLATAPGQSLPATFSFATPSNLTVYNDGTIGGEVSSASYSYSVLQIDLLNENVTPSITTDALQSLPLSGIIQGGEEANSVIINFPGWEDPPVADSFNPIPNSGGKYYPILKSNFTVNGDITTTRTPADSDLFLVIANRDADLPDVERFGLLKTIPGGSSSFNINFPNCTGNPCQLPIAAQLNPGESYDVFLSNIWNTSGFGNDNILIYNQVPYEGQNHYFTLHEVPGGVVDDTGDEEDPIDSNDPNGNNADPNDGTGSGNGNQGPPIYTGEQGDIINNGIVPNCGYDLTGNGKLCGFSDLITLVQRAIEYVFILVVPIVAIVFAYAGYLYLTSGGNPGKRESAKNAMLKSLIGIVVVMSAWLIVTLIVKTLGAGPEVTRFLDI